MSESLSLFDHSVDIIEYTPPDDQMIVVSGNISMISGLQFAPSFITAGEERVLMWEADREGDWSTHWSRRTKSFGRSYQMEQATPYGSNTLPSWSDCIRLRLLEQKYVSKLPNQMGVNEYMPGQGIAPHVDYFGGTIVTLTLGSGCIMDFTEPSDSAKIVSLWLPRRSIVVLNEDARTVWRHGIRGRLKDVVNGRVVRRNRRVSLTFRDVPSN